MTDARIGVTSTAAFAVDPSAESTDAPSRATCDRVKELRARLEQQLLDACEPVGGGLRVWAVDHDDRLEIRGVVVEPEHRGGWAFAQWFLGLPKDRKIVATQVTNERLARVFLRAGFRRVSRYCGEDDMLETVYVRSARSDAPAGSLRPDLADAETMPGSDDSPPIRSSRRGQQ